MEGAGTMLMQPARSPGLLILLLLPMELIRPQTCLEAGRILLITTVLTTWTVYLVEQTPAVTPKFPTHFIMVTSTNLEENQPTTQQLTAQSGTFVSGTISESTPEADPPITIVSRGYTEYE